MKNILKLAWRNFWRNRRRAIIMMASVFLAVLCCVYMMSFQDGMYSRMIDNTLKTQAGHIQIHAKGFWDDKIIDNFMFMEKGIISQLENIDGIENVSPRVETFAMAASHSVSKGIAVIGVSPKKEAEKSKLPERLIQGDYLSENDDGVIIGEGLANFLKVAVGDTLAFIGQGYHGSSAAGLFPIRGIAKFAINEMNNGTAYATLQAVQKFIDMPDGYSGILISLNDNKRLKETIEIVRRLCGLDPQSTENKGMLKQVQHDKGQDYEVYPWHFTMENLLRMAKSDKAMGMIIMYILYLIVGFGIFGTVIMMTTERKNEFCVMISLGMSRMKLAITTACELLVMSILGLLAAFALTLPAAFWLKIHPIQLPADIASMMTEFGMEPLLYMSVEPHIFTSQFEIILVIVLIATIYPLRKILKIKISDHKN